MISVDSILSPTKKLRVFAETQNIQVNRAPLVTVTKHDATQQQQVVEVTEEVQETSQEEPLLAECANNYVIFPIMHDDMWRMYKTLVDNFWSPTDLNVDNYQLTVPEFEFLQLVISVFASPQSVGMVCDNFAEEFSKLIQITEAKFFYGHELFVQNFHYELYNTLMDKLFTNQDDKLKEFTKIETIQVVTNKRNWLNKWASSSFAEQLVASACVHGLFFTTLSILQNWLSNRPRSHVSHELQEVVNKMIHDQELMRDFDCLMVSHLVKKPSKEFINTMVNEALKLEFDFLKEMKTSLIGIDASDFVTILDVEVKMLRSRLLAGFEDKKIHKDSSANKIEETTNTRHEQQKFTVDEDF